MKVKGRKDFEEHIVGVENAQEFGISNNAVIFDVLRKNMYTNPVAAICREIASNSRDANREAGRPIEPIEIRIIEQGDDQADAVLGLSGDMMISFCDHGIGISPSRMTNIFLMYGESTKRADNDQTGGWGLGAKTPFAYCDSFSIITINEEDGVRTKYFYVAGLDAAMKGKMYTIHSEETTEPTGTSITLPLASKDRKDFEKWCRYFTEYWEVPAKLSSFTKDDENGSPVRQLEPPISFTTNAGYSFELRQSSEKSCLLIDGIPYPANGFNLPKLSWGQLNVKFANGILDIAANREYVKDVLENKELIKIMIKSAVEYAHDYVSTYMDKIPTKLDAMLKMYLLKKEDFGADYMKNLPHDEYTLYAMYQIIKEHTRWTPSTPSDDKKGYDPLDFKWRGEDIDTSRKLKFITFFEDTYDYIFGGRRRYREGTGNFLKIYHITRLKSGSKTPIYLVDGQEDRIRQRYYTLFMEKQNGPLKMQSLISYRAEKFSTAEDYALNCAKKKAHEYEAIKKELADLQAAIPPDPKTAKPEEVTKYYDRLSHCIEEVKDFDKNVKTYNDHYAEEFQILETLFDLRVMADTAPTKFDTGVRARRKPDSPVKVQYVYSNLYVDHYGNFDISFGSKFDMLEPLSAAKPMEMTNCVMVEVQSVGIKRQSFSTATIEEMKFISFLSHLLKREMRVIAAAVSKKSIMELGGAISTEQFFASITPKDYETIKKHMYMAYVEPMLVTMSMCSNMDFPEKEKVLSMFEIWMKKHKEKAPISFDPRRISVEGEDNRKTFQAYQKTLDDLLRCDVVSKHSPPEQLKMLADVKVEMKNFNTVIDKYPLMKLLDDWDPKNKEQMKAINHYICLVNESLKNNEPVELAEAQ